MVTALGRGARERGRRRWRFAGAAVPAEFFRVVTYPLWALRQSLVHLIRAQLIAAAKRSIGFRAALSTGTEFVRGGQGLTFENASSK